MYISPILAVHSPDPGMMESLQFIFSGFLFVLVVLAAIGILTSAIGAIFKRMEPAPAASAKKVFTPPPAKEKITDPNIPAVIAAAVYTVMGEKPHRIVQIRPANENWAQEGRRSILGSHKVR